MIARAAAKMPIASTPQRWLRRLLGACALLSFAIATPAAAAGQPLAELAKPERLLMLRHATAPGNGDPPGFRIDDCATQRNLDAEGRRQAAELGQRLARAGIVRARVYSSQWCRCLETARLLGLGPVEPLPALNSFYPRPEERDPRLATLKEFLARLPADGLPVVLVTHQFTITAFTAGPTASGGGSLFQLNGTGNPQWLGTLLDP
jgi:broad specificity phosphatase PhoE